MAVNYGKSTYDEHIDAVRGEIGRDDELTELSPDQQLFWVLSAQERICKLAIITEEYQLRYSANTPLYPVQDRPPITGVTSAGAPISIESAGHGLAASDVIFARDVLGAVSANGRMQVIAATDADNFTIKRYGRITGVSNADEPVITMKNHPFATADTVTIAGVLGATEVNGSWAATKIDQDTFSVDILGATRNAYTGEGTATADATNSTTYVGGGRYWKEDEVPTHISMPYDSQVEYNSVVHTVYAKTFEDVQRQRIGVLDYNYLYPVRMALHRIGGRRYLLLDPKTSADGDVLLQARIQIVPRNHTSDTGSASILLESEYDQAIRLFLKARLYEYLKDLKTSVFYENQFQQSIQLEMGNQPVTSRKKVYE